MTDLLLKIVGGLGLIIISIGVITNQKPKKDILFLIGGVDLLAYSIYIKDPVFIPLQIIFIIASSWEIYTSKNNN
ncbi:MAG: hypothetical protein BRC22_02805 [Parcubacteria group bacterium QH_9_35_7]|nr:MAG: hypothetical protein BRC22_02805 [Parcubacteria group bacterium QH_9_35_7]